MMHIPVLFDAVMEALAVKPGGRYVDGTLGRAGHARGILERGGEVLGIDRDDDAIAAVTEAKLEHLKAVKGNHGEIEAIAKENGWNEVDGVLLDLGVSSPQLDEAGRGFSFMREGPLDMRMDRSAGASAAELVNSLSEAELEKIVREFGEEPRAKAVARAIVRARSQKPIATTTELADIVERAAGRHGAHHGATRTFQALRMAVNDELGELERALDGALAILKPGGRMAVITFESLSDRTVKRFFRSHAGRMVSLQAGGSRWEGALPKVRAAGKAVKATAEETDFNPRARSAKLRSAIKEGV